MCVLCLFLTGYSFTSAIPSVLEEIGQGSVYLSLVLGNIFGVVSSLRNAIKVIRHYRTTQTIKPVLTVALGPKPLH